MGKAPLELRIILTVNIHMWKVVGGSYLCLLGVKSGLWWKAGIGGPSISRIAESVYQDKNQVRGGGGEALPSKPNS